MPDPSRLHLDGAATARAVEAREMHAKGAGAIGPVDVPEGDFAREPKASYAVP